MLAQQKLQLGAQELDKQLQELKSSTIESRMKHLNELYLHDLSQVKDVLVRLEAYSINLCLILFFLLFFLLYLSYSRSLSLPHIQLIAICGTINNYT